MTDILHSFPLPEDGTHGAYDMRLILSTAIGAAWREGRLLDYCTAAGRTVRRVEFRLGGKVALLPD